MELAQARTLVVGATGVLGGAVATALVGAGATVAVTGRDPVRLAERAESLGAVAAFELDLLDLAACAVVVERAAGALGGLDLLVVATGIAAFGAAADTDDAVAEELFAVNTLAPMALSRAALSQLGEGGVIVVLSAILADTPMAGMAAYSASKAALSGYLSALRREVRRQGLSVLDVRPPHMDTGLIDRAIAGLAPKLPPGHDVDEVVALMLRGITEGRRELVLDPGERRLVLR
ncbi:MAG: SDR family oxidoreductase [Geodermatophilaceae bacterium]|nr:SDR family oxidoreductase [Geodermatophilaceae bacterium]